jgi:hypothetical protein
MSELPGRMIRQYRANRRPDAGSPQRTRVSVESVVPTPQGSTRKLQNPCARPCGGGDRN